MKHPDLEKLLERYFEGATSLEEEQRLREAFRQPGLPEPLRPYRAFFGGLDALARESPSPDFEARLEVGANAVMRPGTNAPPRGGLTRLIGSPLTRLIGSPLTRLIGSPLTRAAAIVGLLVAAWFLVPRPQPAAPQAIDWSRYEPSSPEEALQITLQALNRTSARLQEGTDPARRLRKLKTLDQVLFPKN